MNEAATAPSPSASRRDRIAAGILALRDATRMLRGHGAGQRSGGSGQERGVLFDLGALADRLAGYADDQSADDWEDFWLTERDVLLLREHTTTLAGEPRGIAATTIPALHALAEVLAAVATQDSD